MEIFPDRHCKCAQDRGNHTNGTDDQWIDDPLQVVVGSMDISARPRIKAENDCNFITLDMSAAIPAQSPTLSPQGQPQLQHFVGHLRDIFFHFTNQVCPNISCLGVDTSPTRMNKASNVRQNQTQAKHPGQLFQR